MANQNAKRDQNRVVTLLGVTDDSNQEIRNLLVDHSTGRLLVAATGSGTGSVTSVAASGGTTGLSFSGSPITTSGTLTLTGTLVVANGGTGLATTTAYGLIAGGTTSTGNFQNVGTGAAASTVLIGNGSSALPSFSATPQLTRLGLGQAADSSAVLAATGQYFSTEYDAGNSSTAITIDWNNGNVQYVTLTGNCTFTFSNPKSGGRYLLEVAQDGTGSRTVTWPGTVRWPAGTTPTQTATASKKDIYSFLYTGKNSLYNGVQSANFAIT